MVERGRAQRKFALCHNTPKKSSEATATGAACEVWRRLQLIHNVFLSDASGMQVNLSDDMHRRLSQVVNAARDSHQTRSRGDACTCFDNESKANDNTTHSKYLSVVTHGITGMVFTPEAVHSSLTEFHPSSPSSPSSPATIRTHLSGVPSRFSFSSDRRTSARTRPSADDSVHEMVSVGGWPAVIREDESAHNYVHMKDHEDLEDDEIGMIDTHGRVCKSPKADRLGGTRPTVIRSQSAMAVICSSSFEGEHSTIGDVKEGESAALSFNILFAINVIEEAREEVETLVVFDTYQRFMLAQCKDLEQ
jgi:hypothetical protein